MRSARYYELEAKEIRRAMYDMRDQRLRAFLVGSLAVTKNLALTSKLVQLG
jgi:hypothetical protein